MRPLDDIPADQLPNSDTPSALREVFLAVRGRKHPETIPLQSLAPTADPVRLRMMFLVGVGDGVVYYIGNCVELLRHAIGAYSAHVAKHIETMANDELDSEVTRIEVWQARLAQLTMPRVVADNAGA